MVKFTKIFMWVVLTLVIGVDIFLATGGGEGATISAVTKAYSWDWQTIPVAYGVLTGHLFWSAVGDVRGRLLRAMVLVLIAVGCVVLDFLDFYDMMPIIPLVPAIGLGRLLWPQVVPAKRALLTRKAAKKK